MNFGPYIYTPFKSPWAGLRDARNLWAEVQKRLRYSEKGEKRKTHTFSKLVNFGPHILTSLESTRPRLHDARNLWAIV